jgi:pilus assembly protein Flp/PilA
MSSQFKQFCAKTKRLLTNERGQGLVEYALILALIAVVVMAAVTTVGTRTCTTFSTIGSKLAP